MPERSTRLRIVPPSASPEEAAALVAALERFLRETAPSPAPAPTPAHGPWQRAALLEGVGCEPDEPPPWGDRSFW